MLQKAEIDHLPEKLYPYNFICQSCNRVTMKKRHIIFFNFVIFLAAI